MEVSKTIGLPASGYALYGIVIIVHTTYVKWDVDLHDEFVPEYGEVWRSALAFDPKRRAMIFGGGDKSGGSEKRFYGQLIDKADDRFDAHLSVIQKQKQQEKKKRK